MSAFEVGCFIGGEVIATTKIIKLFRMCLFLFLVGSVELKDWKYRGGKMNRIALLNFF
mgnify:CR=1 FL=1